MNEALTQLFTRSWKTVMMGAIRWWSSERRWVMLRVEAARETS